MEDMRDMEETSIRSVHSVHVMEEDKSIAFACIVRIAAVLFVSLSVTLLCVLGNIPDQYTDNMDKVLVREDRTTSRVQESGISFVSTKFKAPAPNVKKLIKKKSKFSPE